MIGNAAPVVAARLSPDTPAAGRDLGVVVDAVDADADPLTLTFRWTVDGAAGPTDPVVPGLLVRGGQRWEVEVTVSDGIDTRTATAAGVVGNTAPRITSVRVEPDPATSSEPLTAVWEAIDYDGDPVTAEIAWEVNGIEVATGPVLPTLAFERDDLVRAVATPLDGDLAGIPVGSAVVQIENGAPTALGALIEPGTLTEGVVARCELSVPVDPDDDRVTAATRWFVTGNLVSTQPTLTGVSFARGDFVQCEATPGDGRDEGAPLISDPVEVGNSVPVLGTVTLDPEIPTAAGPVTAVVGGWYDADADEVLTLTTWAIDGVIGPEGDTLDGLVRGQQIQAGVAGWDGFDPSTTVYSVVVTVGNALPAVSDLALSPPAPTVADAVTAGFTVTDADADPLTTTVQWFDDGVEVHQGNPLPAGLVAAGHTLGWQVTAADGLDVVVVGGAPTTVGP